MKKKERKKGEKYKKKEKKKKQEKRSCSKWDGMEKREMLIEYCAYSYFFVRT